MSDCTEGYAAHVDAEPGYTEAHDYYTGAVAEVFASRALRRALRKTGDRFKMNVIRSVPDSVADRLEVMSAVVVTDAAEEATAPRGKSPAQVQLDRIVEANALDRELPNLWHRVSELGDAYLLVWDGKEEGDAPVVNYLPPTTMRIVYDRDNPRHKRFACHMWPEKRALGEVTRMNLLYADRVERWETKVGMKPDDPAAWVPSLLEDDDPDSWTAENPHGAVPVFHFRNATPYGEPEHLNGYGAQDAVNKIVIAHMSTIDFHLAPQRYALLDSSGEGEDADDFDLDVGFDDEAEEPKTPEEREGRKGLRSGAGEVWWLKGVNEVGQFAPADADTFTKPATFYLRMMAQLTNTPLHIVDESNDEPSGEARRRKEGPLVKKVKDRQQMYGAELEAAYAFALKVAGLGDRRVAVSWAPAEIVSDAEGWATIKGKIEAGVPVRQALTEAGYTREQVDKWFPEGEENTFRIADLAALSDILQKLGAAVAMGIIDAEEARAMLPEGALPEGAPVPERTAPDAGPEVTAPAEADTPIPGV